MSMEEREEMTEGSPEETALLKGEEETDLDFYVKTIEDLRKERDEFYDRLLRKQAEFENYRKRVNRERGDERIAAQADVLRELLPVIDSSEKGLESFQSSDSEQLSTYLEGYQLLLKGLRSILDRFEVEEVPGPGAIFDPTMHEAVQREINEARQDGEILEEYRKGYLVKGRLLRASQVKVSVKPQEEPSEK